LPRDSAKSKLLDLSPNRPFAVIAFFIKALHGGLPITPAIAKSPHIGQNSLKICKEPRAALGGRFTMRAIGKYLLGSAAAIALLSGATMVMTTEASAQFNIDGIIRGLERGGCCYRGYRHGASRPRSHVSSRRHHEPDSDRDAKDDDSSKADSRDTRDSRDSRGSRDEKADAKTNSKADTRGNTSSARSQPSAPQAAESAPPPSSAPPTPAPSSGSKGDEPAFAPAR
jgi:hypothetical protein